MKDRKLREFLGIEEKETIFEGMSLKIKDTSLLKKVENLTKKLDVLFVNNYFAGCPCCSKEKLILKSEAKEFEIPSFFYDSFGKKIECVTYNNYTTKDSFEAHKTQINKWKKEIKELKKNSKKNKTNK